MTTNLEVVPFGKYKEQPIEMLLSDANYLSWVKAQPGLMQKLETRHPALFNIIVTGGPENEDTPEHNSLQLRFLDKGFQLAFLEAATGKSVESIKTELAVRVQELQHGYFIKADKKYAKQLEDCSKSVAHFEGQIGTVSDDWYKVRAEQAKELIPKLRQEQYKTAQELKSPVVIKDHVIGVEFECGFDVLFEASIRYEYSGWEEYYYDSRNQIKCTTYEGQKNWKFAIELKPLLGDDFPNVLRQMARNGATILLVDCFSSRSCSLDQLKKFFATKGKKVITLFEIEEKLQGTTQQNDR